MDPTKVPIILVASGTASAAAATYDRMGAAFRGHFPNHKICWAFSSRAIRRKIREQSGHDLQTPAAVLAELYASGYRQAVVQSLHLICGQEFHHMVWEATQSPMDVKIGLPLLSLPSDFDDITDWVETMMPAAPAEALIMVGHGTAHPSWMTYDLLQRKWRERFERKVVLGLIKGAPEPEQVARELKEDGYTRATLCPFMLVAGAHFQQDLVGKRPDSWRAILEQEGLEVVPRPDGLGLEPAVQAIFIRHIQTAISADPLILNERST